MTRDERAIKIAELDGWEFNESELYWEKGGDYFYDNDHYPDDDSITINDYYKSYNGLMPIWLRHRELIYICVEHIEVYTYRHHVGEFYFIDETFIDALQDALILVLINEKELK